MCARACVCACARVCVRVCVCAYMCACALYIMSAYVRLLYAAWFVSHFLDSYALMCRFAMQCARVRSDKNKIQYLKILKLFRVMRKSRA